MNGYVVTLLAQADLDNVWLHIAQDRPNAADRMMARLETTRSSIGRCQIKRRSYESSMARGIWLLSFGVAVRLAIKLTCFPRGNARVADCSSSAITGICFVAGRSARFG